MHCRRVKVKSGYVWECFSDAPRDPATGKRRQIKRRGKTKKEARQRVEDAIRKLKEDGIDESVSATTTFEQVAERWLEVYAASEVKRGSVRIREKEVKILNRYFSKAPIIEITHHMYQQMLLDLDKQGYAHTTISGVNTCANMIFKYAIRNKLIRDNPRDGAIIPKKIKTVEELEKDNIEETYFESDELEEFLDSVLKHGLELDKEWFLSNLYSFILLFSLYKVLVILIVLLSKSESSFFNAISSPGRIPVKAKVQLKLDGHELSMLINALCKCLEN